MTDNSRPLAVIRFDAAVAPFQTNFIIDASRLHVSDRKRLFDAIRLELYRVDVAFYEFTKTQFVAPDLTAVIQSKLSNLVAAFNTRPDAAQALDVTLPAFSFRESIKAFLAPAGSRSTSREVCEIRFDEGRYQFAVTMPCTESCVHLTRQIKALAGGAATLRYKQGRLTVTARNRDDARAIYGEVYKMIPPHRSGGMSPAVSPALIWLACRF